MLLWAGGGTILMPPRGGGWHLVAAETGRDLGAGFPVFLLRARPNDLTSLDPLCAPLPQERHPGQHGLWWDTATVYFLYYVFHQK